MKKRLIPAADVILEIASALSYSRSHVATVMRDHVKRLRARKEGRHWYMPAASAKLLRELVQRVSGRRYKLGEKGPQT
jgi:hypothetical protein